MNIGSSIKQARKAAGLTQAQLGEKIGVGGGTVLQWEQGYRNPKYQTVERIASSLGVTVSYFMGEPEAPAPEQIDTRRGRVRGLLVAQMELIAEKSREGQGIEGDLTQLSMAMANLAQSYAMLFNWEESEGNE